MEYKISEEHFERLRKRFNETIPGFIDFRNPGNVFQNGEIKYKKRGLERFENELGREGLKRLIKI